MLFSLPVAAQVYVGGESQPSVEVDFSVLGSLPNTGGASAAPALRSYSTDDHQLQKYSGGTPTSFSPVTPTISRIPLGSSSALTGAPMPLTADTTENLNRSAITNVDYSAPPTTAGTPNIPAAPHIQTMPIPATSALEAGHTPPQALDMPAPATITAPPVPPADTTPTGPAAQPPVIYASPLPAASATMPKPVEAAITSAPANMGPLTADDLRLAFKGGDESLPSDETGKIDRVATKLKNNPDLRVELRSFASAGSDMGSKARRLSLSRALMVRSALTQRGIDVDRIDVRALGAPTDQSDADTVDVFLVR